jgi:WD40 repeat protein
MIENRLFIVLCFALFLAGCSGRNTSVAPSPPPAPTPVGTMVPATEPATLTPASDPSATEFAFTATREPDTSTPPDADATAYWITSTAIVEAILATGQPRVYDTYSSPDGAWQAEIVIYDCTKVNRAPEADENAYEQLRLIDTNSGEESVIDTQLENCGGLGAGGFEGLFWSPNSRYFYYTDSRAGVPDGCSGPWYRPYLRLEVNTLDIEELGGGVLSRDGSRLATWQGTKLVIWDIQEGSELSRISPYAINTGTGTGAIAWSPDNRAFVYVQTESYCPVSGKSAIVRVDLPSLEQTVLLESEAPTFGSAQWDHSGALTLLDENGKEWTFDLESRELKLLP